MIGIHVGMNRYGRYIGRGQHEVLLGTSCWWVLGIVIVTVHEDAWMMGFLGVFFFC